MISLAPGPVQMNPLVAQAMAVAPPLHHRTPHFPLLLGQLEDLVRSLFQVPTSIELYFTGTSGTGTNEMMLSVAQGLGQGHILCLENGHFGARLVGQCRALGLTTHTLCQAPGKAFDPHRVGECLAHNPAIGAVAVVHHETSLGHINPLGPLREVCDAHGVALLADMVSSVGCEWLDFRLPGGHIMSTVSGKALQSYPGVGLLFAHGPLLQSVDWSRVGGHYLNLNRYRQSKASHGDLPFTPPIPLFQALHTSLSLLAQTGAATHRLTCGQNHSTLSAAMAHFGFTRVPVDAPALSTSTWQGAGPQQVTSFLEGLLEQGVFLYQNRTDHRSLNRFQLCTLGHLTPTLMDRIFQVLAALPGGLPQWVPGWEDFERREEPWKKWVS